MKVMCVSGSPRKHGNTECLLNECSKEFRLNGWEVSEFFLSGKEIAPCHGCEACADTGSCIRKNDDAGSFFSELETCDAIVIGSPVYYRNVTSQLKALFDRTFAYKDKGLLSGKPGGAIAVGRGEGGGQSLVLTVIHNFLLSCGALCVPGELNGVSGRADKPGDILKQENRLRQARVLARNIIKFTEKISK